MTKGLSTGRLATALRALAAASVFALISALSPAAGAHTARPDLASAVATLPGAEDQATGVSCMPNGPCIAVDYSGQVYILSGSHVEAAGDIGVVTFGVSCPTRTFCAMVSEGAAVVLRPSGATEYPLQYGNGSNTHWQSISCSSPSFCMVGGGLIGGTEDGSGVVASWNGATWSPVQVVLPDIPYDFKTQISSMSCAGPTLCVAADEEQRVLQWNGTKWTAPFALNGFGTIAASCSSKRFCLALALSSYSVWTWNGESWLPSEISDLRSSFGSPFISCLSSSDCVGVTNVGAAQRWTGRGWGRAKRLYSDRTNGIQGLACSSSGIL